MPVKVAVEVAMNGVYDGRRVRRITGYDKQIAELRAQGLGCVRIYRAINQEAWRKGEPDRISEPTIKNRLKELRMKQEQERINNVQ